MRSPLARTAVPASRWLLASPRGVGQHASRLRTAAIQPGTSCLLPIARPVPVRLFRRMLQTAAPVSQATSTPPTPPTRSLTRRIFNFLAISIVFTGVGFAMAAAPAVATVQELLAPISSKESVAVHEAELALLPESSPALAIDAGITSHPLVVSLRADSRFIESRPVLRLPPNMRHHSLTAGTLAGENKISVPPLSFGTKDGSDLITIFHLGKDLCGHPGIIHGGLIATLLDEGLARCCFAALPNKVAMTASLKIDYRAPCFAENYVVLVAETTKVEGRKAWVKGRLESFVDVSKGEKPVVFAEAEALFIEPRQAASMPKVYSE